MPDWGIAGAVYFLYVATSALVRRGLATRSRLRACTIAATGLLLVLAAGAGGPFWFQAVLLPAVVLLVAYWSSGPLWVAPMPRVEQALLGLDGALRVPAIASRLPQPVVELLEAAYVGIYPLIPAALVLHLTQVPDGSADRFWTVILVTDFICFGMLPWIQTRPPRTLDATSPWRSRLRPFNVGLLGGTSIGANTVPSGHAAEAVAAALLVIGAPWPVEAAIWMAAAAVSAGAVFGRYHYAFDVLTGWIVAGIVWTVI